MTNSTVSQFQYFGKLASYCFADDSGKEWDQGYQYQRSAQAMYDAADENAKQAMRWAATGFLWTLKI